MRVEQAIPRGWNPSLEALASSKEAPTDDDLFEPQPPQEPVLLKKNYLKAAALSGFILTSAAASIAAGVGTMMLSGAPGLAVGLLSGAMWGVTAGWLAGKLAVYGVGQTTSLEPTEETYKWGQLAGAAAFVALGARLGVAAIEPASAGGFYMATSMVCGVGGGLVWGQELLFGYVFDENQSVPYRNQWAQQKYEKELQEYEEALAKYEREMAGEAIELAQLEDHIVVGDMTIPRQD